MKKILVVTISLLCIICAGCFKANFDLMITSDGAVIQQSKFIGTAALNPLIEDWKNKGEANNSNKAKAVEEDNMRGYRFDTNYPDIESFANLTNELYLAHKGINKGISRHKSWFFDEYDFDFYWNNPPAKTNFDATVNQAILSQSVFDVSISLPYPAVSTNADEVHDNGKLLKWHLSHLTINGGDKYMNARFKLWHRDKIALTAIVELMFLAATIFFFRKARAEESDSLVKDFRLKRNVFAGLFVALTIVSAYMIFMPVNFTDADIISVAVP